MVLSLQQPAPTAFQTTYRRMHVAVDVYAERVKLVPGSCLHGLGTCPLWSRLLRFPQTVASRYPNW
jgi:hypothetical protein